ncbi:hypothetical protein FOZ63_001611, partial [Perkinsus olseni]
TVVLTLALCRFAQYTNEDNKVEESPKVGPMSFDKSSLASSWPLMSEHWDNDIATWWTPSRIGVVMSHKCTVFVIRSVLRSSLSFSVEFWLVCLGCVLTYAMILPFNNIAAAFFVEVWYPTMNKDAVHIRVGQIMGILFGVSALGSPIAGICIDKLGYRIHFLLASFTMAALAHVMLPLIDPIISMALLGVSYTVFASAVWPLVAATVPPRKTGAAYGVTTAAQNFGLAVTPVIVAHIRSSAGSYLAVERFFSFIGTASIGVGVLLWMRDNRSGGLLNSPARSRGVDAAQPKLPVEGPESSGGSDDMSPQELSEADRGVYVEEQGKGVVILGATREVAGRSLGASSSMARYYGCEWSPLREASVVIASGVLICVPLPDRFELVSTISFEAVCIGMDSQDVSDNSDTESVASEVTERSFVEEIEKMETMNLELRLPDNSRVVSRELVGRFDPPEELVTHLLPYQHEGLAWMCNQEEEAACRGGVLADEMGMGKTLQMIALIVKRRQQVKGPTLVVCPLAAIVVWEEEIRRSVTPPGLLKVYVYHGAKKAGKAELEQYDVVITSYNTLESQYRSLTAVFEMVICEYCKDFFKIGSLAAHQRYCIKDWQKRKIDAIGVKSRESVKREMGCQKYRTPDRGAKSVVKSEGSPSGRGSGMTKTSGGSKVKSEVALTPVRKTIKRSTPRSVRRIRRQQRKALAEGNGPHSVKWSRVILDEAHRIKGRTNSTAKAIYHLRATYRWAVSGTPFQNRVGDLYALVRFLKLDPFSNYFCSSSQCECKSLNFGPFDSSTRCMKCGHSRRSHWSYFRRHITKPITVKSANSAEGRQGLQLLRKIFGNILLRRTKLERDEDIRLPKLIMDTRFVRLTPEEQAFYDDLAKQYQDKVEQLAEEGMLEAKVSELLVLLMRLRQAANSGLLIKFREAMTGRVECVSPGIAQLESPNRAGARMTQIAIRKFDTKIFCDVPLPVHQMICHDEISQRPPAEGEAMARSSCGDRFHNECIRQWIGDELSADPVECPACLEQVEITIGTVARSCLVAGGTPSNADSLDAFLGCPRLVRKNTIIDRIPSTEVMESSKVKAVLDTVKAMLKEDPTNKFLIFSQFTSLLEITQKEIDRRGLGSCGMIHGGLNMATRNRMVSYFQSDASFNILLISLRAAGEGINLQAANKAFVIDPWWNPAAELQAVQRAHRLGQTRDVQVVKFIATSTIEERIRILQRKKQLAADTTVGGDENASYHLQQLSLQDLKFLFKL